MMKLMLCFCHYQVHGLTRVRATGVVPPITPIVSDLGASLIAAHNLAPAVPLEVQTEAPFARRLAGHGEVS